MFRKLIVSNNVLEIYEFEKEPGKRELEYIHDDGYDPLDFEKTKLEEQENDWIYEEMKELRSENRRKQTVRDARNITRRLALMNFGPGDKFITLTYAKNMQDLEQADKDFKNFMKRFRYKFDLKELPYIAVRELQKRGAIHYHMLCSFPLDFENEHHIKYWERVFGQEIWRHGFVDIKPIDHVDNVGAYLIKYMTKNVSIELFKGKKVYLCSKGLERPLVYRGEDAERIIELYKLDEKKEVFTNCYESEYLGNITYKEYNLKRI